MKKTFYYLLFFTLVLIGFWYFLFRDNKNWQVQLPLLAYVKPFSFINQDGQPFTEKSLEGKVTVIEYFFTTCKGICPKMNQNMKSVYENFKKEPNFQILSHTCNPEVDDVAVIKKYAESLQVDTKKWIFLTGSKTDLYNQARNSYLLDDPHNNVTKIEDQFIHTQFFALVDNQKQVRGQIYDALKPSEIEQLKKDIKLLLSQK